MVQRNQQAISHPRRYMYPRILKKLRHNQGSTLIELLLYVSMFAVLLLIVSNFLILLLTSRVKQQTIAEVEQQGMQVMHLITQTVRNAENITMPAPGRRASSLTVDVLPRNNDPTVFDISAGMIRISEGTNPAIALTNNHVSASDLQIQNLASADTPGVIRIRFTLQHLNPSGRNEYDYVKTFTASASLRQP